MIDSGFSGRGTARVEDAQGTPTQSHTSPSILVYEDEEFVKYGKVDIRLSEKGDSKSHGARPVY